MVILLETPEAFVHAGEVRLEAYVTLCRLYDVNANAHRGRLAGGTFPVRFVYKGQGDPSFVTCPLCRMLLRRMKILS